MFFFDFPDFFKNKISKIFLKNTDHQPKKTLAEPLHGGCLQAFAKSWSKSTVLMARLDLQNPGWGWEPRRAAPRGLPRRAWWSIKVFPCIICNIEYILNSSEKLLKGYRVGKHAMWIRISSPAPPVSPTLTGCPPARKTKYHKSLKNLQKIKKPKKTPKTKTPWILPTW